MNNKDKYCKIIFDVDGKILFFDDSSKLNFQYDYLDLNNKRIYNLIYGNSIIKFLKEIEKNKNIFNKSFAFLRKDSSIFIANVNSYKNHDNGNITLDIELKNNISYDIYINKFSFEKINLILRTKFVFGSFIPFLFSVLWSLKYSLNFNYYVLIPLFIGIVFFHISANTFNDYFDWKSGRDKNNIDYVLFSSGGSRAIDFGLITEKKLLITSIFCFSIVLLVGLFIFFIRGPLIIIIGIIGILSAYFYSAPPFHFASRYGLGEILHILCLGPLFTFGCIFSLTGDLKSSNFFIGFPFGFLITGCLLLNEYPDLKADNFSGKFNLAVLLGDKITILFYSFVIFSYLIIFLGIILNIFSLYFLLTLLCIPNILSSINIVFNINKNRHYVFKACSIGFKLYLYFSLAMIISILIELFLNISSVAQ